MSLKKHIAIKVLIFSILFFYLPSLIIGFFYINFFRNEEFNKNLLIIEREIKLFENFLNEKNNEYLYKTKLFVLDPELIKLLNSQEIKKVSLYLKKKKKDYKLDKLYIYDKNYKIFASSNSEKQELTFGYPNDITSKIGFSDNMVYLDLVIPIKISNIKKYYCFSRNILDKDTFKNFLIEGLDLSVIDKNSSIRLFSTLDEIDKKSKWIKDFSNKFSINKIKDKRNFHFQYYLFKSMDKMEGYLIEAIIHPEMYRFSLIRFRYLIINILGMWLFGIFCFIIFLRYNLVMPMKTLIQKTENILTGDYNKKIRINYNNETGLIARNLNNIIDLVKQKNPGLQTDIIKFEKEILYKTKELQDEIENIKSYNNQLTDIFMSLIHDIKNPLTVIGGYAGTIIRYNDNFSEEKKKEFLKRIILETDRLAGMIKNFLNILTEERDLDKMTFNKINIESILQYFYNMYEGKAKERKIDFVLNIQSHLPDIWANQEKIEFVVSNLLSNAFKFVLTNGIISISTRLENDFIKVNITNTGPSIKHGKEKLIFEKYKKISHPSLQEEGAGLGLYIAKAIIQKHGGEIGVDVNQQGGGTTFYFKLPLIK